MQNVFGWWSMSQLDASLRVASPTSIELSWMFCRSTVKQHSQQRVQKMCTRPKLRPPGRECTELRDHLEDGSSVLTFSKKKQSMFEWLGCDATAALLCSKHWTTCVEYRFRVPKPINLLAAEELVSLVRHQVDTGMRSRRMGRSALAKGRSSSHTLNDIRKQLCKLRLFANSVMGKSVRRALTLSACRVLAGGASCAAVGPAHHTSPRSRVPRSWAGVWGRRPPDALDTQVSRLSFRVGLGRRLLFPVWAGRMSLALSGRGCADWYLWDEIGSRATARSEMWSSQTARPPRPGPSLCTVHVEYARAIFK